MKKIAMFNHKGGVSKTTTTFHIGWKFAQLGHRVLLVDADPQCNLTGLILDFKGEEEFNRFYQDQPNRNIRGGLEPAFESKPRLMEPVECMPVTGNDNLFLLPGHIRLSEYDVTLSIAQELSSSIQALKNVPGAISYLIDITAKKIKADIVIIDMNPSLSAMNQNLFLISDYFLVPTSPDYFSLMALDSLKRILPRWKTWAERAWSNETLQEAEYRLPSKLPLFAGTVIQRYRLMKGGATAGFQEWIDQIKKETSASLFPQLASIGMTAPADRYIAAKTDADGYSLAQIPDFNTLVTASQEHHTPVYALSDAQIGQVGTVLEQNKRKQEEFNGIFTTICEKLDIIMA